MKLTRRISFSEFSTYLQCPHKWYLNYLLKLPSGDSDELIFGSVLHSTIESLFGNPKLKNLYRFNKDETIKNIFKGFLKDKLTEVKDVEFLRKFQNKEIGRIFMYQAVKIIKQLDFYKTFADYDIVNFETKLDGVTLLDDEEVFITFKGFIDLILKHKITGRYLILDWKSSGKAWDIEKKESGNPYFYAQLMLYKHFYSQVHEVPFDLIDTRFYNLPRNEPESHKSYDVNVTREQCDEFISFFRQTAKKISIHALTPENFTKIRFVTKKNYCYSCQYNKPDLCSETEEYQKVILTPIITPETPPVTST